MYYLNEYIFYVIFQIYILIFPYRHDKDILNFPLPISLSNSYFLLKKFLLYYNKKYFVVEIYCFFSNGKYTKAELSI